MTARQTPEIPTKIPKLFPSTKAGHTTPMNLPLHIPPNLTIHPQKQTSLSSTTTRRANAVFTVRILTHDTLILTNTTAATTVTNLILPEKTPHHSSAHTLDRTAVHLAQMSTA